MKKFVPELFIFLIVAYWLFLIRPAWLGQLWGTFKTKEISQEYVELKNFLVSQPQFFRTFWIPKKQRFGFSSNNHPAIDAMGFLKVSSYSAVVEWLKGDKAREQLARWAVKYVIIPYDSEGEIFLKDRKYHESERKRVEENLKTVQWLKRLDRWDKIALFETPEFKDHFWKEKGSVAEKVGPSNKTSTEGRGFQSEGQGPTLKWQMMSPTRYIVDTGDATEPLTLVFSENFDKGWVAQFNGEKVYSQMTSDNLNSFAISRYNGNKIVVEFEQQRYVNYGLIISCLTFLIAIGSLLWIKQKS